MEVWGQEFVDLVGPGYFKFNKDQTGKFQFGAVVGYIDWRIESCGGSRRLEFSWDGHDDGDPVHGRGWATVNETAITGCLFFHFGDNSSFTAQMQ